MPYKICQLCGSGTAGSWGKNGLFLARCCETCRAEEDAKLLQQVRHQHAAVSSLAQLAEGLLMGGARVVKQKEGVE